MDSILHPVSGEKGYFCTETEKLLIDAILNEFSNQLVIQETSASRRGGSDV